MSDNIAALVDRYVAMWNEPDPGLRRKTIEDLWDPGGANYTRSIAAVGYDELESRVTRAYQTYVGTGEYRFRLATAPAAHHSAVKIDWEMVTVVDDEVASAGVEFIILDEGGRIVSDHQFILTGS